jgi:predicted ArsR family transcriptional regulator
MQVMARQTTTRPAAPQHHRLLAGITRSRLLEALRASDVPLATRDLAATLGLHPNSVREQLAALVTAGLVVRETTQPSGRGRPALRYSARPDRDDHDPYRDLAQVLAEQLARLPDAAANALAAGAAWGRAAAGAPADRGQADAPDARRRLVALLEDAGFAPERAGDEDPAAPIRLRQCPFEPLARDNRAVVCGVHLGLMRGALGQLGAPLDAIALEPFVAPDLCVAHLEEITDG